MIAIKTQISLVNLKKDQIFEGFLRVRAADQRPSANGSKYLDMTFCDISGDINAKMWDGTILPPAIGDVVKVRGVMQEYKGKPQFRVDKLRVATPADDVDMTLLVASAPYLADDMLDYILERALQIKDVDIKNIVLARLEESGAKLLYYPAAQKLHHSERAGLLHHTHTMLRTAEKVCEIYKQLDSDLLEAGVILHDLCKLEEMLADETGMVSDYSVEGLLLGHLIQGSAAIDRVGTKLNARREIVLMLQHMIIAHHDLPEFGSVRRPMFPEAEMLHMLDLMDARMYEMSHALEFTEEGAFTDKIWSLERKLYKRQGKE